MSWPEPGDIAKLKHPFEKGQEMTLKVSTYCPTCGVKFEYNADTGSDYYHGVSAECPNGHSVCCLPDKVDIDIAAQRVVSSPEKATDTQSGDRA